MSRPAPVRSQLLLRLAVAASGSEFSFRADCSVALTADARMQEIVAAAVAGGLLPSVPHEWVAQLERDGRDFPPAASVAEMGLVHGDKLTLREAGGTGAARQQGQVDARVLEVVAGPQSGLRLQLDARPLVVGRGAAGATVSDPSLSERHFRVQPEGAGWSVEDLASTNGTSIHTQQLAPGKPVVLRDGDEVTAGRSTFVLRRVRANPHAAARASAGTVPHNRPPRVVPPSLDREIAPPDVPDRPRSVRFQLVAALVPLLAGIVLWRVTGQATMLLFCVLSPMMAIGTFVSDRSSGRRDLRRDRRTFEEQLSQTEGAVNSGLAEERTERLALFPDAAHVLRSIAGLEDALWLRRPGHPDYLQLRVGVADQLSQLRVPRTARGDDELRGVLERRIPERAVLHGVPAVVSIADSPVIGICGPEEAREALVRWLVVQLAALHSPRDLQIAAAIAPAAVSRWDWIKWLPHVGAAGYGAAPHGAIATSRLGVAELFASVTDVLDRRREHSTGHDANDHPDLVIVVDSASITDRAGASGVLGTHGVGSHVIWHAERRSDLPGECGTVLELADDRAAGTLVGINTRSRLEDVSVDGISRDIAEEAATTIAPVRDISHADRSAGLPRVVHLAALEGLEQLNAGDLLRRWSNAGSDLRITLGAGPDGRLALDLVDNGPHALVAGTTNAGKSEFLRSALASLSVGYPPELVTFLLVDYKGGAAFRELARLPHTVGIVTDLDDHLAQRALVSLRAEIRRRERLLDEHGAMDIGDLGARAPQVVLPRLLIVIDEFATLVQQIPAFVDGVIDVTQRGRSLGVHLILATQSPRGTVTSKIRANTNIAVALRTVSAEESSDIIGTPDAASIPVQARGRAWVRFGERELVPFQSAYVGASTVGVTVQAVTVDPFTIAEIDRSLTQAAARGAQRPRSDLEQIVAAAADAHVRSGHAPPRPPWIPPLPPLVQVAGLAQQVRGCFGIIDQPARQSTAPLAFIPEHHGSMAVIGAPRSGRTTTLATVAGVLCCERAISDLHVYGLDAAGRMLAAVEMLPHCGSVVAADDVERTARLLAMLQAHIQSRRSLFAEVRASSFEDLRTRAEVSMPAILLLVDDYAAFEERYERVEAGRFVEAMRQIVSDGPAMGIYAAVTADRRSSLPAAVTAVLGLRLTLRLADRDEYSRAGLSPKLADLRPPPGRGWTDDETEVQVATWCEGAEDTLVQAMTRLRDKLEAYPHAAAASPAEVRLLPPIVSVKNSPNGLGAWRAFVGLGETALQPVAADMGRRHLVVAGPYQSGRSTALATIVQGLLSTTPGLETHLFVARDSPLSGNPGWSTVRSISEPRELAALLDALLARAVTVPAMLVVIDDATEISDPTGTSGLEKRVRAARDTSLRLLVSGESQALRTSFAAWHKELLKDGNGILLDPDLELDGMMLGVKLPWRRELHCPPGRGFFVGARGTYELVQVASAQPVSDARRPRRGPARRASTPPSGATPA